MKTILPFGIAEGCDSQKNIIQAILKFCLGLQITQSKDVAQENLLLCHNPRGFRHNRRRCQRSSNRSLSSEFAGSSHEQPTLFAHGIIHIVHHRHKCEATTQQSRTLSISTNLSDYKTIPPTYNIKEPKSTHRTCIAERLLNHKPTTLHITT